MKIGSFGNVYKGTFKNNEVAVKILKNSISCKDNSAKEVMMLQKYQHKNIVKFIGISILHKPLKLVMELVKGESLLNILRNNENISIEKKLKLSKDCAEALLYLENNHENVKLDNILQNFSVLSITARKSLLN